jgi:predicted ATPase/class 3 adenylate cyclase
MLSGVMKTDQVLERSTTDGEEANRVQIRLFGGVGATTDDGRPADVGPAKCQAVLAVLALSTGSAVPVSRLVDVVWGDEPPRTADKTLQSYITRLRKGLGPDSIERIGAAYRLQLSPDSVDVIRFQQHLAAGDDHAALAEWTGVPLAGLDPIGLTATVDGLTEQWLGAVETDLGRRVESDAAATIGSLTELTADYPFREGLWALLMTALYRVDRQADALAAYRTARKHLVEHLGVEPGPRLRELETLILGHDDQLGATRPSATPTLPTGTVTFGFSDVEGATQLWATHRQAMSAAITRHDELVRQATADHDGYVFATGGDSFGVAFNRTSDAVSWATDVQAAIASETWPPNTGIAVRIGLHTGEAEERGGNYFGPAVNVAARIAAAGHGGQTLVSGVAATLLDGGDVVDLGTFRLDGLVADQHILQVGRGDFPPLRTEDSRRGNVPRRLGRLIGRQDELASLRDVFEHRQIVTLIGPGGIGKTRLAVAAARMSDAYLPDGAWMIELAGITSSADVPRAVADALDVSESPARSLTDSIVTALEDHHALLVLDNCEHVIDGAADLAAVVVERCVGVRVLATSREGLGLTGEQLIAVAPLDPAGPAVELFNDRALAADHTFDLDAGRADVEEICRRLDGVPLAIELAAARIRSLTPADLVARLDDRLRLLTGGRRGGVERHRTLRATIQWSYDLLSPPEQALFRRLSIFAGPFDLSAVETVTAGDDLDVLDIDQLLGDLVDRSMLVVESGPFGRRFRLLDTMRQYGTELLAALGHTDTFGERHARWCLEEVTRIRTQLTSHAELEGHARLGELWPNLRAAVDWACAVDDRRLARALVEPVAPEIFVRNQNEISDWVVRILEITPADDEELIVFGLMWAARRYQRSKDPEGYQRLLDRHGEPDHPFLRYARGFVTQDNPAIEAAARDVVAELHRQGDDYLAGLFELAGIGGSMILTGRLADLDVLAAELAARFRVTGPPSALNMALTMRGFSALLQGRHDEAELIFEEAADLELPDGTDTGQAPMRARAALRHGDTERSSRILRDHIEELIETDNVYASEMICIEFISLMVALGRLREAAPILGFMEQTDLLDAPNFDRLVAEARDRIAASNDADVDEQRSAGVELTVHEALTFMRDALRSAS